MNLHEADLTQVHETQMERQSSAQEASKVSALQASQMALQAELDELAARLAAETRSKQVEASEKRRLMAQIQDYEDALAARANRETELNVELASLTKSHSNLEAVIAAAEVSKTTSIKAESFAKSSLAGSEKTLATALAQRQVLENQLLSAETHIRELESRLEEVETESGDVEHMRRAMQTEMDELGS